jgi:hypothetical protein
VSPRSLDYLPQRAEGAVLSFAMRRGRIAEGFWRLYPVIAKISR